ncbi:MAG: hypothetical protein WD066_15645 [Planctomycetaceae bacterium]
MSIAGGVDDDPSHENMSDCDQCWQHIGRVRELYLLKLAFPPPGH